MDSGFTNINFYLPELDAHTRTTVISGETHKPYTLVGPASRTKLTNKIIIDPSNDVSANKLTVDGTSMPIIGTAGNGDVLTAVTGGYQFLPNAGGSGVNAYVKYVSNQSFDDADGSFAKPYSSIANAVTSFEGDATSKKAVILFPGVYSQTFSLLPQLSIVGMDRNSSVITETIIAEIGADVNTYVSFENLTMGDVQLLSSGTNVTDVYFNNVTMGIHSADATTLTSVIGHYNNVSAVNITFSGGRIFMDNVQCSGSLVTTTVQSRSIIKDTSSTSTDLGTIESTVEYATINCNLGNLSFTGTVNLYTDATSLCNTTSPPNAVFPINEYSVIKANATNVIVGGAYASASTDLLTNCTAIGYTSAIPSGSNNRTYIGYNASCEVDNQVAFSDTATNIRARGLDGHAAATNITYDTVTGRINYSVSSRDFKENITPLPIEDSMNLIRGIRPTLYQWKDSRKFSHGIIAEELDEYINDSDILGADCLVAKDSNGKVVTVNYTLLIPHLINCVKTLEKRIVDLENIILERR